MLDLGPGTLPELRRHADFRTLDGIVVSHMHVDHVLDLLALRHALLRPAARFGSDPGLAAAGRSRPARPGCRPVRRLRRAGHSRRRSESPSTTRPPPPSATPSSLAPAVHYVPAWAIRVAAPAGLALGYTGDTGPAAALAEFFAGVHTLVAEATLLRDGIQILAWNGDH